MKTDSQAEIRRMIDDFAAQLEALTRQAALAEVISTLGGDVPWPGVQRRGPGRPAGSGAKRGRPLGSKNKTTGKRGRRSSEGLEEMQNALLAHVKANPGLRGDHIAAALGSDVGTIRGPMKKLIAEGQIRTEGQRRGMTYHVGDGKAPRAAKPDKKARRGGRRKTAKAA